MAGNLTTTGRGQEDFVAALTDAAFAVTARHGVRGSSVDHEVDLWKALGAVVRREPTGREQLVAELTDAAYHVALGHGFRDSFLDVQLDLWRALCRAVQAGDAPHFVVAGAA